MRNSAFASYADLRLAGAAIRFRGTPHGRPLAAPGHETAPGISGSQPVSPALLWRVARDARYAVEVDVVAGEPGQALGLHQGHHQGVVAQQAGLPADTRSGE